nr:hypothetical protein [Tanacetum cinerariifolium]
MVSGHRSARLLLVVRALGHEWVFSCFGSQEVFFFICSTTSLFDLIVNASNMGKYLFNGAQYGFDYHLLGFDSTLAQLGVPGNILPLQNIGPSKDNRISLNDGVKSNGECDTPEYHDTTYSGKKKEAKAFTFYRMETKDIRERYDAPCFVNDLEVYDGEINLDHDKNLISNEFAVKLCLEHEVKNRDKVVKKEFIVALRREIYFVKFIINPKQDDEE